MRDRGLRTYRGRAHEMRSYRAHCNSKSNGP